MNQVRVTIGEDAVATEDLIDITVRGEAPASVLLNCAASSAATALASHHRVVGDMTPEQILEQAYADCAMLPPLVLPTKAWITGHPSTMPRDSVRDDIARYANADFPREACGFLLSTGAVVHCTNVADDPYNSFHIDQLEADAWWATELVVGVWHSHATGAAVPSERDSELAVTDIAHVIYSVEEEDLATYQPRDGALHLVSMEGPE